MHRAALALLAAITVVSLAACEPTATTSSGAGSAGSATTAPATAAAPPAAPAAKTGTLPNLVGKGLQTAQDTAQAAGFYNLTSHDALGRDRLQIDDRNWKVCTQTPAPGAQAATAKVDLGAVKLDETCPAQDQGAGGPTKAGGTMPDFKGRAVSVARDSLPGSTSISVKDASPQNRMVLVQSNWQVCTQDPAPGTALTGQPVTIKAVKFGESCP
ncbi:hypothetical protein ACIBCA_31950 [Kitasatospora sp. NPDC051170]|uniref:hypothetical protein n=1 Tax=Kitasatospora sp. NPDC051170 TaxID=3364056 RepID=UPI0037B5C37B